MPPLDHRFGWSAVPLGVVIAGDVLVLVGFAFIVQVYRENTLGVGPVVAMAPFLIWRLFDEERILASNLPGYADHQRRVPHRLVPFVW